VPDRPNGNINTLRPDQIQALETSTLRAAYERAETWMSQLTMTSRWPGYRLFWFNGPQAGAIDVPTYEGAYWVVGRHTSCDVRLDADPRIALRHVLVRCVPTGDGGAALRLLDLRTSLGFSLENGVAQTSIFATGPLTVSIGFYVLVALPTGRALPQKPEEPVIEHTMRSPYRELGRRDFTRSHINVLPRVSLLGEDFARLTQSSARLKDAVPQARLTLTRAGRFATIDLSDDDLDAGIIIGRSDKCANASLRAVLDESISRVHLLILRDMGEVFAFDVCSLQGTYASGRRVRRFKLVPGAQLAMGGRHAVTLNWAVRA
jgi:pSer/pThr/pTyr-binding forkhead associated (FHA) protein